MLGFWGGLDGPGYSECKIIDYGPGISVSECFVFVGFWIHFGVFGVMCCSV